MVGAGPAGLSAALAARSHGIPVTVLEAGAADRVRPGGRALFVHGRTLRLLEETSPGLGATIASFGIVWRHRRTFYRGREVYSRTFPPMTAEWPPFTSLRQTDTERFMLAACVANGVRIEWETEVESVSSTAEGVIVEATDGRTWSAEYVIGADGARSAVRAALGIPLSGSRSDDYHVAVDLTGQVDERVFHYHHPEMDGRHVIIVPFAGGRQVDVQCRSLPDAVRLGAPDEVARWLPSVGGAGEVTWISCYPFLQRVADTFVDPQFRVLLVGEAAHLFAPLGARGMNSGIADAVAAAGAVARSLRAGDRAAVARYDRERRESAHRNRAATGDAAEHMNPSSMLTKARQEAAARLAPVVPRFGAWLDAALYGPRNGGRY